MRRRVAVLLAAAALGGAVAATMPGGLVSPPPARAGIPVLGSLGGNACDLLGTIGEGWWGKACNGVLTVGGKLAGGAQKVATGVGKVAGNGLVQRGAALAALVAWVIGGAKWTMDHMAGVVSATTSPTLTAGWFTGLYLRVEGIGLLFTLLFVCAAAAEALLRSDAGLLARAMCVQLPLSILLTAVATPLVMLLLAASDQLSDGLATVAAGGSTHFLTGTSALVVGGLTVADPFFAVLAGGLVVAAGGALWVELLIREIAVYVVVAMLPLVFAAMVWPARRVWATRAIEVLVALILSKVAIVVVLALGGAALDHAGASGISKLLGGLALVILGAFSPWLLLRLVPMAELAAASVGHVRGHLHASAGVRTPEAALAGHATTRLTPRHRSGVNGRGDEAAGPVRDLGVNEMLEQMHRRADARHPTTAQSPAASGLDGGPAAAHNGRDAGPHGATPSTPANRDDSGGGALPGGGRLSGGVGPGPGPDGAIDRDAWTGRPPWDSDPPASSEPSDADGGSAPPVLDPPDGRFFDDEESR